MLDNTLEKQTEQTEQAIQEADRVIRLEGSRQARVYGIKLDVICTVCGSTWGIKLLPDYKFPMAWFECLNCKRNNRKNENVNQSLGKVEQEKFSDGTTNS